MIHGTHESQEPLADVDATLALFGRQRAKARRAYVRMLRGEREQPWVGERPGRLPWWGRVDDIGTVYHHLTILM